MGKGQKNTDKRVPVTIVTGFLGSGKSTFINYVMKAPHGLKIAIIENEFGEIDIDSSLVVTSEEDIIVAQNGCLCCTVRGDLVKALETLAKRRNGKGKDKAQRDFDHVIIETTGLADPAPVAQTFFMVDAVQDNYRLDSILTIVDAKHLIQHLDDEKPEGVENESVEQVAIADRILLNKTDLVTEEEKQEVLKRIKAINHFAPVIECQHGAVPLPQVLGVKGFDIQRVLELDENFLKEEGAEHQHDKTVSSVGIEVEGELDLEALNNWLSDLLSEKSADLFRSKGIFAIEDSDDKYFFQGVHMLLSFGTIAGAWGKVEKRASRLVFIGRNLNKKELMESLAACRVEAVKDKATDSLAGKKRASPESEGELKGVEA